jgi:carbamoyltransferase
VSVILGLNAYHGDSAACIVVEGQLLAAAEEERFRRIKHWAGFPSEAIRYCLQEAGVSLGDVTVLAVNSDSRPATLQRIAYVAQRRPSLAYIVRQMRVRLKRTGIAQRLQEVFPHQRFDGRIERVEHHIAHLASAYYLSPWNRAAAVSVDGFGDFASAAWGFAQGGTIHIDGRVHFPHSLGILYEVMTQYLGFPHYGDEYKVMGLAPYGEPRHLEALSELIRLLDDGSFELNLKYFRHATEQITSTWDGGEPTTPYLLYTPLLEALLGPARKKDEPLRQRHWDLARSTQALYERAFFHLLRTSYRHRPCDNLVLAGGRQRQDQARDTVSAGIRSLGSRRRGRRYWRRAL